MIALINTLTCDFVAIECAGGSVPVCGEDPCNEASCASVPGALCMRDPCSCTAKFVHPVTMEEIDCEGGKNICTHNT